MKVGIFMGSKSDLDTVSAAFGILDEFGIEYEYNILSAVSYTHLTLPTKA